MTVKLFTNMFFLAGIICLLLGMLGYVIPISDNGLTITEVNKKCQNKMDIFNQELNEETQYYCELAKFFNAIYFLFGIGFILVIIGLLFKEKKHQIN